MSIPSRNARAARYGTCRSLVYDRGGRLPAISEPSAMPARHACVMRTRRVIGASAPEVDIEAAPAPPRPAWQPSSSRREDQGVEAHVGQDDDVERARRVGQEREGETVEPGVECPAPAVEAVRPAEHGGDHDRRRPPGAEDALGHYAEIATIEYLGARRRRQRTHHTQRTAEDRHR